MQIGGWKTHSVFDRYSIVSPKDVADAGRKLEVFHGQQVGDKLHRNAASRFRTKLIVHAIGA